MRKLFKYIQKFLFWLFFVSLFLVTLITVLLHIYEDDIKQFAIDKLNKHLTTELKVQSIELSLFHDFPRASLEFRNVLINDAYKNQKSNDTLLFSQRAFCSFNIWDIWNGDYKVKRLAFEKSKLNLRISKDGEPNYNIIKEDVDTTDESNFKFVLELLKIDDLKFQYLNLVTGQHYRFDFEKGLVKGDFTQDEFELVAETAFKIKKLKSNSITLIRNKPATLNLKFNANTVQQKYTITNGEIEIAKMPFVVKGSFDTTQIDMAISGNNIKLEDLVNSIAAGSMNGATKYKSTGVLDFHTTIKGELSSTNMPAIDASFDLENGTLTNPSNNMQMQDVILHGKYQNQQKERIELLHLSEFSLKLLNSKFEGDASIEKFNQPYIKSNVTGNLNLGTFHQFFKFPGIETAQGTIDLDLDLEIEFLDPEYRQEKFTLNKSNGSLYLNQVSIKATDDDKTFRDINGNVIVLNNDAAVKNLTLKTAQSDFVINGAFNNLLQYLSGLGELGLVASLESSNVDLNEFIGETQNQENQTLEKFELPDDINLNLDINFDSLKWDHHIFNKLSGNLVFVNRKATATNLSLKTCGGHVSGMVEMFNNPDEGNSIETDLNFMNVNVKSLFEEWENFGQESIMSQHISGSGKGNVNLIMLFNPYFSLIEESIVARTYLEIANGELNELETMKMITDYMRSNNALKLMLNKHIDKFEDKLTHLKFENLSNTIEIKDRKILIPKMLIKSNALNIELFGWHDFDNNVEYHFSFRFRDLKTIPEYTEFGKIEDDGLGIVIYLTMTGPLDNPTFALDSDERKNDLKENMANEKQDLKSMLKTEFGIFKKDTTVQQYNQNDHKQVEFIFYEDEEILDDTTTTKNKNKTKTSKFFNKLREDSEKDKDSIRTEFD